MKGLTTREKEHLRKCKAKHYQFDAAKMGKLLLVCGKTGQFVDLEALGKQLGKVFS